MSNQLRLVERVRSKEGWSSKDTRTARWALEKLVHHESVKHLKVKDPYGVLQPAAFYLGFLGLGSVENSVYSMTQKAQANPNYIGSLDMILTVRGYCFRLSIVDNGEEVRDEFNGELFEKPISPYKQPVEELNSSRGDFLTMAASLITAVKGTFGYRNRKQGAIFWYEMPCKVQ